MNMKHIIAERLQQWMESDPWLNTAQKIEARSGVGASTINRMRRAEANPTLENLMSIARAFGRPVEDLLRAEAATNEAREPTAAAMYLKQSADERTLLAGYRMASEEMRECILELATKAIKKAEGKLVEDDNNGPMANCA